MKGKTRQKVWLALAAVMAACLVLAGCPHNGLLDVSDSNGGGADSSGGRGGSDGVQLIVTNFVTDAPVANRSASWLNPNRTIAPEHIPLTNQDAIDKYVFVVLGSGGGDLKDFVTIAPDSGTAALNITGGGTWNIEVRAYDISLLNNNGVLGDKTAIIGQGVDAVIAKPDAMVLKGSAILDLKNGRQVTLTLSNDGVGTNGWVDIAVHFTNQTEADKIFDGLGTYTVAAELVDLNTQVVVPNSTQILYNNAGKDSRINPIGNFKYYVYDKGANTYTEESLTGTGTAVRYWDVDNKQKLHLPKGKYQLRVTVEHVATNEKLYKVDNAFYIDGNVTTQKVFTIDEIFGTQPQALTDFKVYWTKPGNNDQREGYDAEFRWVEKDFNAVGYTIEVLDITSVYLYNTPNKQVNINGQSRTFTDAASLWTIFDNDATEDEKTTHITKVDWKTTPQDRNTYPIWKAGSLLGGSNTLTLRLESGHVYSARIRADNGSNSFSAWEEIGVGTITPLPAGTEFTAPGTHGIFDLMKFAYVLKGVDMYTLTGTLTQLDVTQNAQKIANSADLIEMKEYIPGVLQQLKYGFTGATVATATLLQDDQVLVANADPANRAIVDSWQGWQNKKPGGANELFGPADTAKTPLVGTWGKDDWTYSGYKDLQLEPVGAGGSSIKIQSETAGTFDVLTLQTVAFGSVAAPTNVANQNLLNNLTQFQNGQVQTAQIYKNAAGTRLVVVIKRTANGTGGYTYTDLPLYVAIGDNATDRVAVDLTDKNGNKIDVANLVVKIQQNSVPVKTTSGFFAATNNAPAYAVFSEATGNGLGGMQRGHNYNLVVEYIPKQGYPQTLKELPLSIVYEDQATIANVP